MGLILSIDDGRSIIVISSVIPREQFEKKKLGEVGGSFKRETDTFSLQNKNSRTVSVCVSVSVQKECGEFCVFVCICVFLCGLRVLDCGSVAALSYRRKPVGEGRRRRVCARARRKCYAEVKVDV